MLDDNRCVQRALLEGLALGEFREDSVDEDAAVPVVGPVDVAGVDVRHAGGAGELDEALASGDHAGE